ncbi:hypothetical protein, partial [Acrocarpospora phusangensis]|uniref:hypothetical protein n=1 Tax=Acrocarpospora phusangensis TaxID=1070424 RepID=UPI0019508AE4
NPLGSVTGLLGGSGSPVEQVTGTLGGLTGGLGGVTGALPGVTDALPGVTDALPALPALNGRRMMTSDAVSLDALLDTLQISLGSVPVDVNETVASLGGVVQDVTGSAARLSGATAGLTSTVQNVIGGTESTVAEVANVTQFGNIASGTPSIGSLNLRSAVAPVAEKLTGTVAGDLTTPVTNLVAPVGRAVDGVLHGLSGSSAPLDLLSAARSIELGEILN